MPEDGKITCIRCNKEPQDGKDLQEKKDRKEETKRPAELVSKINQK
jgi:hypothetical protein